MKDTLFDQSSIQKDRIPVHHCVRAIARSQTDVDFLRWQNPIDVPN